MTTNKPEVVGYLDRGSYLLNSVCHPENYEPLIRLSDYEALQAECEKLREHLQNLIDQTTPLEPVPGNPMWSRRIQLDEVMAERDQLRAECEKLRKDSERYRWIERHADVDMRGHCPGSEEDYGELSDMIDAAIQSST